ncbi:hypothetical protein BGZ95_007645 [Linnemannia exigua]|uniref:DUF676 domain-containing protein n=1 Tax=Linnemannia exigua TaxID=604196 RepID=A0AAD4DL32_9FUNG|nr:hypothetical protein BGZ95_007645 [Linnemannia exigua]
MPPKPVLAISHKVALSVGGIIRYRIKLLPSQAKNIDKLQFRIRNSAPIYRNITPSSGPWKIAVALVRNPDKLPVVPELVPSIGCAQVCRLDASVENDTTGQDGDGCNEWELEVLSEMILQHNWIDVKVEVYVVPRTDSPAPLVANSTDNTNDNNSRAEGTDADVPPHILLPAVLSCNYKDTRAICGPARPEDISRAGDEEGLHLVLLTHGIHGSWLDMLYIKEQIDAHNKGNGKTITFLTDTNHAGTEEGIQMAGQRNGQVIATLNKDNNYERLSTSSRASKTKTSAATTTATTSTKAFPRGISKVSIIGHSLGGLINVYALGFIEELTQGAFFKTIQPTHFITLATPLLGVGFEHPWVLGYALSLGVIGQTGKDLALENRTSRLRRSASSATFVSTSSSSIPTNHSTTAPGIAIECTLDKDPEPLLLAMARPGSASNRVLRQFVDRTSYANIENDMAVKFNTSSMMGIPSFDMDHFFSPEGAASQPKKSIYHSAVVSILALLLPQIPPRAKFLGIADAPSPVVIVDHVAAGSVEKADGTFAFQDAFTTAQDNDKESKKNKKNKKAGSVKSTTSNRSSSRSISGSEPSSQSSSRSTSPSSSSDVSAKSRLDLALLVSEGYHTGMDWTKIGVFIEHEAHVQIIVRRKWYNLDGWKCVQDLAERFDFS